MVCWILPAVAWGHEQPDSVWRPAPGKLDFATTKAFSTPPQNLSHCSNHALKCNTAPLFPHLQSTAQHINLRLQPRVCDHPGRTSHPARQQSSMHVCTNVSARFGIMFWGVP
eukprot:364068-Chlamydomonas_euryale.AAC.7